MIKTDKKIDYIVKVIKGVDIYEIKLRRRNKRDGEEYS